MFDTHCDNLVHDGLRLLIERDHYLLEKALSERSITHKLGEYYQHIFGESWNVDCEYNKNCGQPKTFSIAPEELLRQMAATLEQTEKFTSLFVEYKINLYQLDEHVVYEKVHELRDKLLDRNRIKYIDELDTYLFLLEEKKGKEKWTTIYPDIIVHKRGTINNLIVIEAKKTDSRNPTARAFDFAKLMTLTTSDDYQYQHGYFIELPVGGDFEPHNTEPFQETQIFSDKVYKILSSR